MVIALFAQVAVTPAGRPVGTPIPVAPVVVMTTGFIALLTHTVGFDDGLPAVFCVPTVITMLFELTVAVATHAALLVIVHETISPSLSAEVV